MKRKVLLVLTLALTILLIVCACNNSSPIVGTWKAEGATVTMYWIFNADGTSTTIYSSASVTDSNDSAYTYDERTGTVTFHDNDASFKVMLSDDTMYLTTDEGVVTFKKQ